MENKNKIKSISLFNRVEELSKINDWFEKVSDSLNIPLQQRISLNLVLEEVFTNIVKHAYSDEKEHKIEISLEKIKNSLKITIIDDGKEYNPTLHSEPDINLSAEKRQVGGLGILMIKNIMDKVEYYRLNNKNHLSLTKLLS